MSEFRLIKRDAARKIPEDMIPQESVDPKLKKEDWMGDLQAKVSKQNSLRSSVDKERRAQDEAEKQRNRDKLNKLFTN